MKVSKVNFPCQILDRAPFDIESCYDHLSFYFPLFFFSGGSFLDQYLFLCLSQLCVFLKRRKGSAVPSCRFAKLQDKAHGKHIEETNRIETDKQRALKASF